jgi:RHS repeat-associated protein
VVRGSGRTYADLSAGSPTIYTYNASHKHALASLSTGETYSYDANGNTPALHRTQRGASVTQRVEGGVTYTQTFDAENRLISVTVSGQTTTFIYNGDGNLVKKINPNGSKTIYVGGIYEVDKASGGSVTRTVTYYPVAGAMRINSTLYYVLKDHLGSASVVTDASGTILGTQRYYPFGETRLSTGSIPTDKLYTSQREITGLGIYDYQARYYSPKLGRFLSPDTIISEFANPQSWNRYSYVYNNPIRYNDPTGHCPICVIPIAVADLALVAAATLFVATLLHPAVHDAMVEKISGAMDSVAELAKRKPSAQEKATAEREANNGVNAENWLLPIKKCFTDAKTAILCGLLITGGATILHNTQNCGQVNGNEQCLPNQTLDPDPVSTPTLTQTSTSTPTQTSTSTPTQTSTPTAPIFTPAPNHNNGYHIPI